MNIVAYAAVPSPSITIGVEQHGEGPARNALLDRAMAQNWRKKSSNALRRGFMPSRGLAIVARDEFGSVVGTVRLWDVADANGKATLLLGPLAVDQNAKSSGIGSSLMTAAIAKATKLGHGAILLVGDAAYYQRFGFSDKLTANLAMPGPFEKNRFLGLELIDGALEGASGTIVPTGRKLISNSNRAAKVA